LRSLQSGRKYKSVNEKLYFPSKAEFWRNIRQPATGRSTGNEERKLRSGVNWQRALKQYGVKQTGVKQGLRVNVGGGGLILKLQLHLFLTLARDESQR